MGQIYDGEIDKSVDWGGDQSTGGLPVSGRSVQEFIKNQLAQRIGELYYDERHNRYMCFADVQDRDAYLSDPEGNASLLLGVFDAPANYNIEIAMTTPTAVNILKSQKNNYIDFTFDVKVKSGASTGDSVICNYTFNNAGNKVDVQAIYNAGEAVHFLIDDYIKEGVNTISISMTGRQTLATTTVAVIYNVIDLQLKSGFNFWDVVSGSAMSIPYRLKGMGVKYMEWYVDGVKTGSDDTITDADAVRTKNVQIGGLEQGRHNVQLRAYVASGQNKFYSDTIYFEFVKNGSDDVQVMVALRLPEPVTDELSLSGVQYEALSFDYAVYDPQQRNVTVEIKIDDETIATTTTSNGTVEHFSHIPSGYGDKRLSIVCDGEERNAIMLKIDKSSAAVDEATGNVMLRLLAAGRSNSEVNPGQWTYDTINTFFRNFAWNDQSGWDGHALVMSGDAEIEVRLKPLMGYPTSGRTIEIEYECTEIEDQDAVICECVSDTTGAGFRLTASSALLRSSGGTEVVTRYKSGDRVKIAFIVNPVQGADDARLMFIVNNGVLERAESYGLTDSFTDDDHYLKIGGTNGKVKIKLYAIRVYGRALSEEEEFENYAIDSGNVQQVVSRNDVYSEGGRSLSADKISAKIPVLIFTGDIPTLLASSDKNTTVYCDIEYINNQDTSKSFRTTGTRVRLQGTSSLGYPRKNFRFYTNYGQMYDSEENVIAGGMYQFKASAQPVNCWCLKADYAESSGSHNTGVARMWNDFMRDVQIGDEYVCRTNAQKAAVANGYNYDVRTTVDGFPIVVFYRTAKDAELVCMGQYNFNNDKSTAKVFGFNEITGFDNSKVECWECTNNTHPLALFTDASGFDAGWQNAFESRYPDVGSEANTAALKTFVSWVASTRENVNKFKNEKAQHLDIWKMAAYYVYLMRFGAVDQVVKNSMLTTEDGVHWYYINYDNDTIMGVRNDARLIYDYEIDRQSIDPTLPGTYAYAGHDSVLWNNIEADAEFMSMVKEIDNALYSAGMSYDNCMRVFDAEQSDKWCERIYNDNGRYKYIQPYKESGTNNLFMLQGKRESHRHWWLSNRFDVYDAMWVSGRYKSKVIEFKAPGANGDFTITAGTLLRYGYGINNDAIETNVLLSAGESYNFTTPRELAIGDPVRIYAASSLRKLDLSNFKKNVAQLSVGGAAGDVNESKLRSLILGAKSGVTNSALTDISGLSSLPTIEELDVRGFLVLTTLPLQSLKNLKRLLAENGGLREFAPAQGAELDYVSLPSGLNALLLDRCKINTLSYVPSTNLRTVTIDRISGALSSLGLVRNWMQTMNDAENSDALYRTSSLTLSGISWTGVTAAEVINLKRFGYLSIKGYIRLSSMSYEEMRQIVALYGDNVFKPGGELVIDAPSGIVVSGPAVVYSGSTATFVGVLFPIAEGNKVIYRLYKNGVLCYKTTIDGKAVYSDDATNVQLEEATGIMTVKETLTSNIQYTVRAVKDGQTNIYAETTTTVERVTYPTEVRISGEELIGVTGNMSYSLTLTPSDYTGKISTIVWTLDCPDVIASLSPQTGADKTATMIVKSVPEIAQRATLSAAVTLGNGTTLTDTLTIAIERDLVIMTHDSNPNVLAVCYAQGWCASESQMLKLEAKKVDTIGTAFKGNTYITHFEELAYFEKLKEIPDNAFSGCSRLEDVIISDNVLTIGESAFEGCTSLRRISDFIYFANVNNVKKNAFKGCSVLEEEAGYLFNNGYTVEEGAFEGSSAGLTYDSNNAPKYHNADGLLTYGFAPKVFKNCTGVVSISYKGTRDLTFGNESFSGSSIAAMAIKGKTRFGESAFENCSELETITWPTNIKTLGERALVFGNYAFRGCENLNIYSLLTKSGSIEVGNRVFYGAKLGDNMISGINLNIELYDTDGSYYGIPKEMFIGIKSSKLLELNMVAQEYGLSNNYPTIGANAFSTSIFKKIKLKTIAIIEEGAFANALMLEELALDDINQIQAPVLQGNAIFGQNGTYAGTNIATGKILRVRSGATGFEVGQWADPLCAEGKCGFTLSYV